MHSFKAIFIIVFILQCVWAMESTLLFQLGDNVQVKNADETEWQDGLVIGINPLKVRLYLSDINNEGNIWDDVRTPQVLLPSWFEELDEKEKLTIKDFVSNAFEYYQAINPRNIGPKIVEDLQTRCYLFDAQAREIFASYYNFYTHTGQINPSDNFYNDDDIILMSTSRGQSFCLKREYAEMCGMLKEVLENDHNVQRIDVDTLVTEEGENLNMSTTTMQWVVDYLIHHEGKEPAQIPKPLPLNLSMYQVVKDAWDADFMNSMTLEQVFEVIQAADEMRCRGLLELGCVKVAMSIRYKSAEEVQDMVGNTAAVEVKSTESNSMINNKPPVWFSNLESTVQNNMQNLIFDALHHYDSTSSTEALEFDLETEFGILKSQATQIVKYYRYWILTNANDVKVSYNSMELYTEANEKTNVYEYPDITSLHFKIDKREIKVLEDIVINDKNWIRHHKGWSIKSKVFTLVQMETCDFVTCTQSKTGKDNEGKPTLQVKVCDKEYRSSCNPFNMDSILKFDDELFPINPFDGNKLDDGKVWGEYIYNKSENRPTYRIWSESAIQNIKKYDDNKHPLDRTPYFSKRLFKMNLKLLVDYENIELEFDYEAKDVQMETPEYFTLPWGMEINCHKFPCVVKKVTDGQQAANHGIKVNWKIIKWNGVRINDENYAEIYSQFTSETRSKITFDTGNQPLMPIFN